jgi:prevent-host-death family protein
MSKLRLEMGDVLNRVSYGGERVIVCRYGRPFVAIIPAGDLEIIEAARAEKAKVE